MYLCPAHISRPVTEGLMTLHIRDDRAARLARQLAEREGITVTQAVVNALEAALAHEGRPLPERLREIAAEAQRLSNEAQQRTLTKQDIDALWGNE